MKNQKHLKESSCSVPPKGGGKRIRGKSYLREKEPSKKRINLYLSHTVIEKLGRISKLYGISRSELIERHFRELNEKELTKNGD